MNKHSYSVKHNFIGGTNEIDAMQNKSYNPRQGSDVYTKGSWFEIKTVQTKLSPLPGSPTFPVKQWLRHKHINTDTNSCNDTNNQIIGHINRLHTTVEISVGGIIEEDYGEESYP